jgi:hypothetical protein
VVRSSIVERRPLIFYAMCGETAFSRNSKTKIAGAITLFDTERHELRGSIWGSISACQLERLLLWSPLGHARSQALTL